LSDTTVRPLEISTESLFEKLLTVVFLGLGSIELEWNMSPQGVSRAHHFLHTFFQGFEGAEYFMAVEPHPLAMSNTMNFALHSGCCWALL
jgi:hypothetical protein